MECQGDVFLGDNDVCFQSSRIEVHVKRSASKSLSSKIAINVYPIPLFLPCYLVFLYRDVVVGWKSDQTFP